MKDKQLTVSDLSQLIAAREETRAELHLLALEAWQHWRELEAKLEQLEAHLFRGPSNEHGSGVYSIDPVRPSMPEPPATPPSGKR
jgi:hypothetical protein